MTSTTTPPSDSTAALIELYLAGPTCDPTTAARFLRCSRNTAYTQLRAGEFPVRSVKIGRKYKILTADLLRVLDVPLPEADPTTSGGAA